MDVETNKTYFHFSFKDSKINNLSSEEDWEDGADDSQKEAQESWIDVGSTLPAKEKLIRILVGKVFVPKQC